MYPGNGLPALNAGWTTFTGPFVSLPPAGSQMRICSRPSAFLGNEIYCELNRFRRPTTNAPSVEARRITDVGSGTELTGTPGMSTPAVVPKSLINCATSVGLANRSFSVIVTVPAPVTTVL